VNKHITNTEHKINDKNFDIVIGTRPCDLQIFSLIFDDFEAEIDQCGAHSSSPNKIAFSLRQISV
jgi:hypothetical protein